MRNHEIIYSKCSDFFRKKGLCEIKAQILLVCQDELMKLCLKNCIPLPGKKKFLQEKQKNKKTRNDLIMITPATPKNRHTSEK